MALCVHCSWSWVWTTLRPMAPPSHRPMSPIPPRGHRPPLPPSWQLLPPRTEPLTSLWWMRKAAGRCRVGKGVEGSTRRGRRVGLRRFSANVVECVSTTDPRGCDRGVDDSDGGEARRRRGSGRSGLRERSCCLLDGCGDVEQFAKQLEQVEFRVTGQVFSWWWPGAR